MFLDFLRDMMTKQGSGMLFFGAQPVISQVFTLRTSEDVTQVKLRDDLCLDSGQGRGKR